MFKVDLSIPSTSIKLIDIPKKTPIFAKRDDKLVGILVKEPEGWLLRVGSCSGANGHHKTRRACLESCLQYNYTFFVDI